MLYSHLQNKFLFSKIALGTVELGVDYGIQSSNDYGKPTEEESKEIIELAYKNGINLYDTAPGYKTERLLGTTLNGLNSWLMTKVLMPPYETENEIKRMIHEDIYNSAMQLHPNDYTENYSIPIVLLYNPTVEQIKAGIATEVLKTSKQYGFVELIGASVYTEEEALAVIDTHDFDILQVSYNMLDRRMGNKVFYAAHKANMFVVVRSALLKGVLTKKALYLSEELFELKEVVIRLKDILADGYWNVLSNIALRFCLFASEIDSMIVGVRTKQELIDSINAMRQGKLSGEELNIINSINIKNKDLLDPRNWPFM